MAIELQFTDKEISPWGGMGLMKRLLDRIGFDSALRTSGLPEPGSNRGYRPEQLITQFMLSVWCRANRFEHQEVTRHNPVLQRLFGFSRMANFEAVMRLFRKFSRARNERVMQLLYRWWLTQLSVDKLTLDLDSTVITRYGAQAGARRSYNPRESGRASHHPLIAFISNSRIVANFWLRPDDAHTANNSEAFLDSALDRLGDKQVVVQRADSGFGIQRFLEALETRHLHHIVALALHPPWQRALVNQTGWWCLDEGIKLVSFAYQSPSRSKARQVIGIRQHIARRENAKGKTLSLFADDPPLGQYRFAALVTNLDLPTQAVWRLYRERADCENRINELKYDFAADRFCLNDFWANEACLSVAMLTYNLMSLFRQAVLKTAVTQTKTHNVQHTLKTLRYKLCAKAGYLTHEGRRESPNLSLFSSVSWKEDTVNVI
ncbi:MAG: IS1380 family transposase [Sulfuricaulis sp.]